MTMCKSDILTAQSKDTLVGHFQVEQGRWENTQSLLSVTNPFDFEKSRKLYVIHTVVLSLSWPNVR